MNYTLHQLQVFAKVVQVKSVTKAASELFMSQPAVSIQLKNFQDQFEIPLTEVVGRQLYVTQFGMEIYQMAERIINEVYAINYKTMAFKGHLTGRLSVAVVSTGKYIMPYFLDDFVKGNEGIDLLMDVTNKLKVSQSLQNNEIDFALVSVLPKGLIVNEEELIDNELYLIASNTYFNIPKSLKKEDIQNLPFIFREEGSGTRNMMEDFFTKNKIQIRKKLELTSNEAVKQAIVAGLGCSIMPLIGIRNELLNGDLKIIPFSGLPMKSKWRIIWLKNKKLSPVAQAYIEHLNANKEKILKERFQWLNKISDKVKPKK
jgi:DNA-binding transcriptional LysR family regulator